jgi:hypothetical protein
LSEYLPSSYREDDPGQHLPDGGYLVDIIRATHSSAGGLLMAALAGHLEGHIVGGVALDLDGTGGQVVEVLVEELNKGVDG